MSWASSLCALYDANAWRAGEIEYWNQKELILLPISHTTIKARIEIILDSHGKFFTARALGKNDNLDTVAPATEKSMSRTSTAIAPHPLFDSLKYVAGDFLEYVDYELSKNEQIKKEKHVAECFSQYLSFLKSWCNSDYSNPKVCAVYEYVNQKSLIRNLMEIGGILSVKDGRVPATQKVCGEVLEKAAVRFRIMTSAPLEVDTILNDSDNSTSSAIWLDKTVQQSFVNYYSSISANKALCYISGEKTRTTALHPKKIRYDGDGTKLISSNDNENFTYRGRFNTKDKDTGYNEALSIGYETSQKIHNALKWIIRRQGYVRDGLCIVAWESDLKDMPHFYDDAVTIIGKVADESEETDITDDVLFDEEEAEKSDTNYASARDLNMAIDGYSAKLSDLSSMVIMALDSATPGRLALIYYRELATSCYLENIRKWQESCCWRHEYFKDKRFCQYEGMASISEVAKAVYGTEQNKRLTLRSNSDGKCPALISAFNRLRPCIIDGAAIPHDIVRSAVEKASNPVAYEKDFNYLRVLHIACSLVKRYYWEKGVIFDMKLDEKCTNRSYLFGRLLAVAEKVERSTFDNGETRITNAERYMQQFSRTPFRTWELIRRNTQIYLKQLKPSSREYYKNLYSEIEEMFKQGAFDEKKALDGRFLLGYDCQRTAKHQKNDSTNKTEEELNNTEMEEN